MRVSFFISTAPIVLLCAAREVLCNMRLCLCAFGIASARTIADHYLLICLSFFTSGACVRCVRVPVGTPCPLLRMNLRSKFPRTSFAVGLARSTRERALNRDSLAGKIVLERKSVPGNTVGRRFAIPPVIEDFQSTQISLYAFRTRTHISHALSATARKRFGQPPVQLFGHPTRW